ncbi:MAG TPA: DoxX family protein [Ktedonobacterales bacterium]
MSVQVSSRKVNAGGRSLVSRRMIAAALWTIQGVLAFLFLFAGGMKLIVPVEVMLAQMPLSLPGLFVHFIGVCEVAGALGLILPGLTRIGRQLTPVAAWALVIEMGCATVYTLIGGGGATALFPLIVGLLCAAVAYGRRSYFATA